MRKIKKFFSKYKKVYCVYLVLFAIGILMTTKNSVTDYSKFDINNLMNIMLLKKIFLQNSFVISLIYIISLFSGLIPLVLIAKNGYVLGMTVGHLLKTDIRLLLLILPHGIFEIPCLLATGYIIVSGKEMFKTEPKKIVKCLLLHVFVVFFIAVIEVYVTPSLYLKLYG